MINLEKITGKSTSVEGLDTLVNIHQGYEPKWRQTVDISKNGSFKKKGLSLIFKTVRIYPYSYFIEGKNPADWYLKTWHSLKQLGLPVLNTVRKVDETTVAMTDLNSHGWNIYGKHSSIVSPFPTDRIFVNISKKVIKYKANKLLKLANKNNVLLASDDAMSMAVHQDEGWCFLLLDIGTLKMGRYLKNMDLSPKDLINSNQLLIDHSLYNIYNFQEILIKRFDYFDKKM